MGRPRQSYKRSSSQKSSLAPKAIIALVILAFLTGGVFYFAGQAEKKAPEPTEMRMEAQNVTTR